MLRSSRLVARSVRLVIGVGGLLVLGACGGGTDDADAAGAPTDAARLDGASHDARAASSDVEMAEDGDVGSDASLDGAALDGAGSDGDATTDAATDASRGGEGGVAELCDRYDQDLDGRVDEGACHLAGVSTACRTEVRASGQVYAVCSTGVLGISPLRAWAGRCEGIGPGYQLVDLDDEGEQIWASAMLGTQIAAVGLRRFGYQPRLVDSSGVDRDPSSLVFDPASLRLDTDRCLMLTRDGLRQVSCGGGFRTDVILCEGPVVRDASSLCVPAVETCDATDQDCDGRVDETGCPGGCRPFRAMGHTYYSCEDQLGPGPSRARCQTDLHGDFATIDSDEERMLLGAEASDMTNRARFWVGLEFVGRDAGVGTARWYGGRPVEDDAWFVWDDDAPNVAVPPGYGLFTVTSGVFRMSDASSFDRPEICETPTTYGP